jgi:hypothetical protein
MSSPWLTWGVFGCARAWPGPLMICINTRHLLADQIAAIRKGHQKREKESRDDCWVRTSASAYTAIHKNMLV